MAFTRVHASDPLLVESQDLPLQTCQPSMEENDATSQKDTDDEWIQMDVFTDDNICDNELVQPPNVSDQCTHH